MSDAPRTPKQEQEPPPERIAEVAPGVLRLALPIQMTGLGHVNMYALLDDRGAAIVDPGMPGPLSWRSVQARLKEAGLKAADVHTVIVTHSHPDHFGGAAQLADEAGADVLTHAEFQSWHRHGQARPTPAAPPPWGGESPWGGGTSPMRRQMGLRRRVMLKVMGTRAVRRVFRFPEPTIRVEGGDVVKLAGREWQAVHTPGHTTDHLCLYDPEHGLLLSGDHVLPTITPHISGMSADEDPLGSYNESLDRVAALGQVGLVLPAHGHPFPDLAGRVAALKAHHEERCDQIREISASLGPATVTDFSHHLFRRERWGGMAESETYAHLEHLRLRGEADRRDEPGGYVYEVHPRP